MSVIAKSAAVGLLLVVLPAVAGAQGFDPEKAKAGEEVYENYCFTCHGEKLRNTGQSYDLRRLRADERERFDRSVRNGKNQMPPWRGVLSDEEIDQIWNYIRANANDR